MQYTIAEVTSGVNKVVLSDDSWSFVKLTADMREADLDNLVHSGAPNNLMTGENPSFVSAGSTRTASAKPAEVFVSQENEEIPAWLLAGYEAYGSLEDQIEFITENGLRSLRAKVAQIKVDNPKPSE